MAAATGADATHLDEDCVVQSEEGKELYSPATERGALPVRHGSECRMRGWVRRWCGTGIAATRR
eukprot:3619353-Rhodomonas_salina.1